MLAWLAENIVTIAICAALIAAVTLIIAKLVKGGRAGKAPCGCDCAHCALAGKCHSDSSDKK